MSKTNIIFIIDESGSMHCMGKEPINSVNEFIDSQKVVDSKNTYITIVKFNNSITHLVNNVPINEFKNLTLKDYCPESTTALNDAIASTIKLEIETTEEKTEEKKLFVIITDGSENSSSTFSLEDVRKYVDLAENKYGWNIIFCGANIDSFTEGSNMRMSKHRCSNYDQSIPGNLSNLCRSISSCVTDYRQNKNKELIIRSTSEPILIKTVKTNRLKRT